MRKRYLSGIFALIAIVIIGGMALSCGSKDKPKPTVSYTGVLIKQGGDEKQGLTVNGKQGETLNFTATVEGKNNPSQAVTWTLAGKTSTATTLSDGELKIAADEDVDNILRVTVTSNVKPAISAWVDVKVIDPNAPLVNGITVTAAADDVALGGTLQFTANADAENGATTDVTWSITSTVSGTTAISATGLLTVDAAETATSITVQAASVEPGFESVTGSKTVAVYDPNGPRVVSVTLSAAADDVALGGTLQFTVVVNAENSASTAVTWSITSTVSGTTAISASGLLTVDAAETATSITVQATPVEPGFESKAESKTVTVYDPGSVDPKVTDVTVLSLVNNVTKGGTLQFSAMVTAEYATTDVTWSITSTVTGAITAINATGLLTVDAAETAASITVQAASAEPGFEAVTGSKTVTVLVPENYTVVYPVYSGIDSFDGANVTFNSWNSPLDPNGVTLDAAGAGRTSNLGLQISPTGGAWWGCSFVANNQVNITGANAFSFWAKAPSGTVVVAMAGCMQDCDFNLSQNDLSIGSEWTQIIMPLPDPSVTIVGETLLTLSNFASTTIGQVLYIDNVAFINITGETVTLDSITLPATAGPIDPNPATTDATLLLNNATASYTLAGETTIYKHNDSATFYGWYNIVYTVTGSATVSGSTITPNTGGTSFEMEVTFGGKTSTNKITVSISGRAAMLIDDYEYLGAIGVVWGANGAITPEVTLAQSPWANNCDPQAAAGYQSDKAYQMWYDGAVPVGLSTTYTGSMRKVLGGAETLTFMIYSQFTGASYTVGFTPGGGGAAFTYNFTATPNEWLQITVPIPAGWTATSYIADWFVRCTAKNGANGFKIDDLYAR